MRPAGTASPDDGDLFETPVHAAPDDFVIDVDGYEGPLDLLLKLARDQKVDLTRISILALAEQYLAYIQAAHRLRLELAADYLVMAAWLAYLKSRLLLPSVAVDDAPAGEELAAELAERLRRLESMRTAASRLFSMARLGSEIFRRGMPEPVTLRRQTAWEAGLFDLLSSYAALRLHRIADTVRVRPRDVFSLTEARERLTRLLGASAHWAPLDSLLMDCRDRPELRATARASALSASLEMVRENAVELRQSAPFAPLYIRRRIAAAAPVALAANG